MSHHFVSGLGSFGQARHRFHYKESELGEGFAVETIEDQGAVADHAKAQREFQEEHGLRPGLRELYPIAEIPMTVVERSMREGWFNDKQAWRKWANDPDNAAFRIAPREKRIIRASSISEAKRKCGIST